MVFIEYEQQGKQYFALEARYVSRKNSTRAEMLGRDSTSQESWNKELISEGDELFSAYG